MFGAVFTGDNFNFFKNDVELIVTQRASLLEEDFKKKLLNPEVLGEKVMGMDNHTRYFDEENYFGGIYPLKLLTPNEKKHLIQLIYKLEFERLFDELCYSVEAKRKIAHRIFEEIMNKLQLNQFQTSESFAQLNKTIEFLIYLSEYFGYIVYSKKFSEFTQFLLQKINGHLHIKNLLALPNILEKFDIQPQPFLKENVEVIEMDDEYIKVLFGRSSFGDFFKILNQDCFVNQKFVLRITKSSSSNYFQLLDRTIRFLRMMKKVNFLGRFEFHLTDDLIEDFNFISQRPELFLSDKTSKEDVEEIISLFKV